jgi:hypothetical protein
MIAEFTYNFRPTFNVSVGISEQAYACGECDSGDKTSGKCADCDTADCNAVIVAGEDYKCDSYSFNDTAEEFKAAEEQITCKSRKDEDKICNK